MDVPYRDDREAALAAADALRRENDDLRSENEYLRGVLDPRARSLGRTAAQLQGALAVVSLCVGAMTGVAVLARDLPAPMPCGVTRNPAAFVAARVPDEPLAVEVLTAPSPERPDARRRWRDLTPAPAPVVSATVTTARLALAFAPSLGAIARCVGTSRDGRSPAGVHVAVMFNAGGEAIVADATARRHSREVLDVAALRCVERAVDLHATALPVTAPFVRVRYTVAVANGRAQIRRVRR